MEDLSELPTSLPAAQLLAEIDAQQDELLAQLDQLNGRLEEILRECSPPREESVEEEFAVRRRAA